MKEKTLLRIAFISSCFGILLLFIFSKTITIDETTMDKIDQIETDEEVRVKGVVKKVTNKEKLTIIELIQEVSVPVIVFENISVNIGEEINVIGKKEEYNGKDEILAEVIEK